MIEIQRVFIDTLTFRQSAASGDRLPKQRALKSFANSDEDDCHAAPQPISVKTNGLRHAGQSHVFFESRQRLFNTSKECRLTNFVLETLDSGKLIVNRGFSELFQQNGWQTFDVIWQATQDAMVAKKMRTDRITLRFTLKDQGKERSFYIKRHGRSSLKEYLKPLMRLTWPILGARNEWNAILEFHRAGIATMTPVALGESGSNSFLITEAIEDSDKLSELRDAWSKSRESHLDERHDLIYRIASITRSMHGAGLHHQDYYLGHLLRSKRDAEQLYVIDLGRVRKQAHLSQRWIVKDLAQLDFSADATPQERLRFFRQYLGRPFTKSDRKLMNRIQQKKAAIARHSIKNRL